jgi:hypothetical protein
MRLIIAGSRKLRPEDFDFPSSYSLIGYTLGLLGWEPSEIVSGMCRNSPDMWGLAYAEDRGLALKPMPADWNKYGRYEAGKIRNHEMGDYADRLLCFWNGVSDGTKDMFEYMRKLGKPYEVFTPTRINNSRNLQDVLNDKT